MRAEEPRALLLVQVRGGLREHLAREPRQGVKPDVPSHRRPPPSGRTPLVRRSRMRLGRGRSRSVPPRALLLGGRGGGPARSNRSAEAPTRRAAPAGSPSANLRLPSAEAAIARQAELSNTAATRAAAPAWARAPSASPISADAWAATG